MKGVTIVPSHPVYIVVFLFMYICIFIYIHIYNYIICIIYNRVYIILYISLLFNTFFCTSKLIKNKYNLVAKRDRIIIHCIFYIVVRRERDIYLISFIIIFFHYLYYVSDRNADGAAIRLPEMLLCLESLIFFSLFRYPI